jgi:heme O synthase-like polyprenyltransferase
MNHRLVAQYILAGIVIVGFFAVLALMLWKDKSGADILVGGLAAAFGSVVGYYYGSSASSARKDELIAGKG